MSVRYGEGTELHSSRMHLEEHSKILEHGPTAVVYKICDTVVDGFLQVAASLEIDVDEVEASVFSPERTNAGGAPSRRQALRAGRRLGADLHPQA